jgi:hypothetical protein
MFYEPTKEIVSSAKAEKINKTIASTESYIIMNLSIHFRLIGFVLKIKGSWRLHVLGDLTFYRILIFSFFLKKWMRKIGTTIQ